MGVFFTRLIDPLVHVTQPNSSTWLPTYEASYTSYSVDIFFLSIISYFTKHKDPFTSIDIIRNWYSNSAGRERENFSNSRYAGHVYLLVIHASALTKGYPKVSMPRVIRISLLSRHCLFKGLLLLKIDILHHWHFVFDQADLRKVSLSVSEAKLDSAL